MSRAPASSGLSSLPSLRCTRLLLGEAITGHQIWKHASRVAQVRTEPGDRVALLQLDAQQPVVLVGTAAAVWILIDGHRTQTAILAELGGIYNDVDGQMHAQLSSFFASLAGQNLIEPAVVGK